MIRFTLPALLMALLFGGLFLVASFWHYKNKYKITYHPRNMFPYELNYKSSFADNFYGNTALILTFFAFGFLLFTFDSDLGNGFSIFIIISGIITFALFLVLTYVPLDYIRSHCSLFVFYLVFSAGLPAAIALRAYTQNQLLGNNSILCIIVFILAIVTLLVVVALALNPKLTLNMKMKEEIQKDGTIKYIRPNVLTMAFTEWMLFFLLFVDMILLFTLSFSF